MVKISDLVVAIGSNIIMISGILTSLVKSPMRICIPQAISKLPTKLPKKSCITKSIFLNHSAPIVLANKNCCTPSERYTAPQ